MEQAESSPKLEKNTEQSETNIDSVATATVAIGKSDKENKCTESLSPAVDPLLLETGPGDNKAGHELSLTSTQLCLTLLRRWHELQPETNHRVRSQLRVQSSASTDNVVTIELSDEENEVLLQSNTKTRVVDDAETAHGGALQKDDGELQNAYDLMIKGKNCVRLALSTNKLDMDGRDVQENLSEDVTTDNVLDEQEADDENPSRNGDEEMFTCALKLKYIALEDELHERKIQNLAQQTPEQQPGNKDLNERVANENYKSTVHPDRGINVHTLHLSEDKLKAEVRKDKSKLLHENQSKIRVFNDYVLEQKNNKNNPRKRADHLIITNKRISSKKHKIRTERESAVRYENISTSRDNVETRMERTRNDSIQLNNTKYIPGFFNKFDPVFQTFRKDYSVRKSISVKSYKGFEDKSKKVSKDNNFNMTLNVYEDLEEGYRLFSSPKQTAIGEYLIHEEDPGLGNNDNKGNARPEVDLIGDENTLSRESKILRELQEVDVSNIEAIIDLDSDEENANFTGIAGNVNKNRSNRVTKTYSAFRRNTTQGDNETRNIATHENRENSSTVNVDKGCNRIRKRKSCESEHEISKQNSSVTNKNASSKSTENDDATILETGCDNARFNKNNFAQNKRPRKRQQNESISKDIVNFLRDHNYVDMNRRSSCSSAGAGTDDAEAEIAVDASDPNLLVRPVVVTKKPTDQIRDEMALRRPRSPTPISDLTPPLSPVALHKSSPLVTPRTSRSTTPDFSAPAPKSVKKRRARKMLLNERNERSSLTKRVELPDIEEVRRHNRNILTAQVTPIKQHQGGLVNTASCDHNKSSNTSSSPAPPGGCSRCAAERPAPGAPGAAGRARRPAAARARSFITTMSKKREYILSKARRKPIIIGARPYRRKRRRGRPRFTSPDNVSNDDENMPTRDLVVLENEEAIRSNNPVPRSETITSKSNDTPSILNEGLPTRNLATHPKEQDTIFSSNSVAGCKSVPSNSAPSVLTEGIPPQNFTMVQREQNASRHSDVVTQSESSNALVECSTQNLSMSRKEREPHRIVKRVTFNIPMHDVTAIQKERKKSYFNPVKIGVKPKRKQRLRSESPDDASSAVDESELMRDLIILDHNLDPRSLRPASSNAVPILDGVPTTQSNQVSNTHRNSVPSNTVPSISNAGLPTQGLTIVCYPNTNTRTYGFIAPSSTTARDPSDLTKNIQTQDVISTLNNRDTASKLANSIDSVPSSPPLIQNKLDTCKRVKLPLPTAYLDERRNSVDSMLHEPLIKKVKASEERKQQKTSSKSGFKPLLFRRGSVSKNALPKEDNNDTHIRLHEQGTTNFSNAKGNEIKRLGIKKVTSSCDNVLANNGSTLISSTLPISAQTNQENQNTSLEPVSEIASGNSVPNVAELNQILSPEVLDTPQAECHPVIVSVQSLAPSQGLTNARNLHTPVITLKQAKPVCLSYLTKPSREIHDFTSDPKDPKEVIQQLPKIISVSSYTNKQVIQSTNDRENCHNLAATLKRKIPSSEQVKSPMTTHLKAIRESDVQSSQKIDRVESLGPEPIQPKALPKITLKRAQPVYASYHSLNEMEVLIAEPQEEGQEMHLPRVGDVTGDLHVIQPDDRMGLHIVVSQDEADSLSISRPNF